MEPQSGSDRAWAALAVAAAAVLTTTVSVGLALARVIPDNVSTVVPIALSSIVLALHGAALHWAYALRRAGQIERLAACGTSLIGPSVTAFAWSGGHWPAFLWVAVLLLAGLGASVWWVADRCESSPASLHRSLDSSLADAGAAAAVSNQPLMARSPVSEAGPPSVAAVPPGSEGVLQRIERRLRNGCETIDVEWQVDFAAGESLRSLHLPITPPLRVPPQVECEPLDDADVDIIVGACHAYGVRLDVRRRGETATPARSTIGVCLQATAPAAA